MRSLHSGKITARKGAPLEDAHAAVVMLHGRGDTAEGILSLALEFMIPGVAFVAPQATNHTWYPHSFLMPLEKNEPWLTSALDATTEIVKQVAEASIPHERIVLLGFSQGACLALEWTARHARRYGGAVALSGGLIGPDGTPRAYEGTLEGTPVFLGCSDVDAHIPLARVHDSASILGRLGGTVEMRIYPNFGHTVNHDEVAYVHALLQGLSDG